MGVRIERKKPKQFLLSFVYRLHKLLPLGSRMKLRLYLDLEWIFDRLAMEMSFKTYRMDDHPFRTTAREFLIDRLDGSSVVLDLGCNQGDMSVYLAERARKVIGVDHDGIAIENARRKYQRGNLEFHHLDALEYLEQSKEQFTVLVLSHILEHLDHPEAFLKSFKDHFRNFYIELPDFDKSYLNHYRDDLGSSLIYTDDDHVTEFDRYELKDLLDRCGIEIVEAEYRFGIQRLWCRNRTDAVMGVGK